MRSVEDRLVVVVKPTSRCNAACRYCCARKESHGAPMSLEQVRRVYDRLAEFAQTAGKRFVTVLWHGGEPLLMGPGFYREAWGLSAAFEQPRFNHRIQSNLLLLNQEWIDLLREFEVRVGTSVDPVGTDRILPDGRPQLPIWMRKFRLALEAGLSVGIVFVVTPAHIDHAQQTYAFFRSLQPTSGKPVSVRMNPVYPAGAAAQLGATGRMASDNYARFLLEVEEEWMRDGRPFPISPFAEWSLEAPLACDFTEDCTKLILGIDALGDVYKCGRYMETGTSWGNLEASSIETILDVPARQQISRRSRFLRAGPCRDCAHWALCHGGCPYQAELAYGDPLRKSPFCDAYVSCLDARHDTIRRS